jgi:hypothetical protein
MTGDEARAAVDSRMIGLARARLSVMEMWQDGRIGADEYARLMGKIEANIDRIKAEKKGQE